MAILFLAILSAVVGGSGSTAALVAGTLPAPDALPHGRGAGRDVLRAEGLPVGGAPPARGDHAGGERRALLLARPAGPDGGVFRGARRLPRGLLRGRGGRVAAGGAAHPSAARHVRRHLLRGRGHVHRAERHPGALARRAGPDRRGARRQDGRRHQRRLPGRARHPDLDPRRALHGADRRVLVHHRRPRRRERRDRLLPGAGGRLRVGGDRPPHPRAAQPLDGGGEPGRRAGCLTRCRPTPRSTAPGWNRPGAPPRRRHRPPASGDWPGSSCSTRSCSPPS